MARNRVLYPMLTEPLPVPPVVSLPPLTWLAPIQQPIRPAPRLAYLIGSGAVETMRPLVARIDGWQLQTQQPVFAVRSWGYLYDGHAGLVLEPVMPPIVPMPPTTGILALVLPVQGVAMTTSSTTGVLSVGPQTTGILEVL